MPSQRLNLLSASMALAMALLAGSMLIQVPAAKAGAADADAREIVRLINGARHAAGRSSLNVDIFLASKARDGAIPCPDDSSKTIAGRTRDFAATGHLDHVLRLCHAATYKLSSKTFVSTLQTAWGYGAVGEVLLVNGGYGNGKYLYTYKGWSTWTYATTGHAMKSWASSSSHWSIVMGSYDRVGCGSWAVGSTFYYACEFSRGGPSPSGLAAPPTRSPFSDPLPTPKPTPVPTAAPTRYQAGPTPCRTAGPPAAGRTTAPGAAASTAPASTPAQDLGQNPSQPPETFDAAETPDAAEFPGGTSLAEAESLPPAEPPFDGARAVAIAASGVAVVASLSGLILLLRRRRLGGY